jgi:cyclic pyranopterin phosphate synthase
LQLIATGQVAKGDVMTTARLAGIMAAKRTPELIPLCHPIPLTDVEVEVTPFEDGLEITATVRTVARTGVEMEALVAVTVAALTVYDMVKAVDRSARIGDVRLVRKSGGKSGELVLE